MSTTGHGSGHGSGSGTAQDELWLKNRPLVGGWTNDQSCLSTIYLYKPDEDNWTLLDARIKEGKSNMMAMFVDQKTCEIND
jgi:hypothetical protein